MRGRKSSFKRFYFKDDKYVKQSIKNRLGAKIELPRSIYIKKRLNNE